MAKGKILPQIDTVVVLMLENRSFDNLAGWLYGAEDPRCHFVVPPNSPHRYQGLDGTDFRNPTAFQGGEEIPVQRGTDSMSAPTPDPNEKFKHMNQQLFGDNVSGPHWLPPPQAPATMNGFVVDYAQAKGSSPEIAPQIMQTYTPDQVHVLSTLARQFAISDAWHASNPTQTLPNRAFMAAGTSEGHVNNMPIPVFRAKTIFNVLQSKSIDWCVYNPSRLLPSLTRLSMMRLWSPLLERHFRSIEQFADEARAGHLPPYSFLEPNFIEDSDLDQQLVTSEHPPTDVCGGEHYLSKIWDIVRTSPQWKHMLFIVTYDEHGGCADHIQTPWGATPPTSPPEGDEGFGFDRFGVRIPTLMASPYITPGTVFRSFDEIPYDHTSILATVLDWQCIPRSALPSDRVAVAPTFENILGHEPVQLETTPIAATCQVKENWDLDGELTDLEEGIMAAFIYYRRYRFEPLCLTAYRVRRHARKHETSPYVRKELGKIRTRRDAVEYIRSKSKRN